MACNVACSYTKVGRDGKQQVLGSKCPGMGWTSAVGVTEMAHRSMVRLCNEVPPNVTTPTPPAQWCQERWVLDPERELRRDRPFPVASDGSSCSLWLIFIDNLDMTERVSDAEGADILGSCAPEFKRMDERYLDWQSPSSEDKAVDRALDLTSLGVRTRGDLGRRDMPPSVLAKVVDLTLWMMCLDNPPLR